MFLHNNVSMARLFNFFFFFCSIRDLLLISLKWFLGSFSTHADKRNIYKYKAPGYLALSIAFFQLSLTSIRIPSYYQFLICHCQSRVQKTDLFQ